jgi:plasmid maintenance system antidote protein VapI
MNHEIHIGRIIQARVKADGRSVQWLARQLHCTRSNIYKLYDKPAIATDLLWQLAQLLQVDFFAYYSNSLKDSVITQNR